MMGRTSTARCSAPWSDAPINVFSWPQKTVSAVANMARRFHGLTEEGPRQTLRQSTWGAAPRA
eukprot:4565620-Prymnesium_polylepis.1